MARVSKEKRPGRRVHVAAIVPSAGLGRRMALKTRKPFVLLKGIPIVVRTLRSLALCPSIDSIIIASERTCVKKFETLIKRYRLKKIGGIIVGGRTRFESVRNCLAAIGPEFDIVLVHDGARPFVERSIVDESIRAASKYGACVAAVPESDTVKLVYGKLFIKKTLDRKRLYRAQTPQAFRYGLIRKAYSRHAADAITDDSSLVENLGARVKIVAGSYRNIKITTKEDIRAAEAML